MPLQPLLYWDGVQGWWWIVRRSQCIKHIPIGGPHTYFTTWWGRDLEDFQLQLLCVPRFSKWLNFVLKHYSHFKCFQWLILMHSKVCYYQLSLSNVSRLYRGLSLYTAAPQAQELHSLSTELNRFPYFLHQTQKCCVFVSLCLCHLNCLTTAASIEWMNAQDERILSVNK